MAVKKTAKTEEDAPVVEAPAVSTMDRETWAQAAQAAFSVTPETVIAALAPGSYSRDQVAEKVRDFLSQPAHKE
jgi:hypothetical protein